MSDETYVPKDGDVVDLTVRATVDGPWFSIHLGGEDRTYIGVRWPCVLSAVKALRPLPTEIGATIVALVEYSGTGPCVLRLETYKNEPWWRGPDGIVNSDAILPGWRLLDADTLATVEDPS